MKNRRKGRGPHETARRGSAQKSSKKNRRDRRQSYSSETPSENTDENAEVAAANRRENSGKRPANNRPTAKGRVVKNPRGFAFVVLDPPVPGVREDVFLDVGEAGSLITNDLVEITIETDRRSGRKNGKLVQVLERGLDAAVGEYKMGPYGPCVEIIGKGMEVSAPVAPGGKFQNIIPGSAVLAKLRYENLYSEAPTAEIVSVIGQSLDHSTDDLLILTKYKLRPEFPKAVMDASDLIPETLLPADYDGREDLRKLAFITIDGPTAKDFDDAVYAERLPNGNLNLFVAVADVGHYVKMNDAIDLEAIKRGNSTYLPTMVVPMLPERLSNGLCSLNPRVDRLVMVAEMEFEPSGKKVNHRFMEAVIHSHRRCTYEEVQSYYNRPNSSEFQPEVIESLKVLYEVYKMLNKNRLERGAIDLDIAETQVVVAPGGEVKGLKKAERWDSHRLIEECMLAANEAVAEFLTEQGFAVPYRVHEPPELEAVHKFTEVARTLGANVQARGDNWNHMYQAFLKTIKGSPAEAVLNFLLLRSMKQAYYTSANLGHFALASGAYAHFTSPIRRYPDLILHRQLKGWLKTEGKNAPYNASKVDELAQQCSRRERHSMDAEREMIRIKQVRFAEKYVGEEFTGKVISMNAKGLFIELEDLSIEGFLEIERLGYGFSFNDRQMFFRASRSGRRIMLGDKINVVISRTNPHLQRIDLDPAENTVVKEEERPRENQGYHPSRRAREFRERSDRGRPSPQNRPSTQKRAENSPSPNASRSSPGLRKLADDRSREFRSSAPEGSGGMRGPGGFLARMEHLKASRQQRRNEADPNGENRKSGGGKNAQGGRKDRNKKKRGRK